MNEGMKDILVIAIFILIFLGFAYRKRHTRNQRRIAEEPQDRGNQNQHMSWVLNCLPPPAYSLPPIVRPNRTIQEELPMYSKKTENIYEYPHCPVCWSRNREGEPQKVFWDERHNRFYCGRNHYFRRNGKLITNRP